MSRKVVNSRSAGAMKAHGANGCLRERRRSTCGASLAGTRLVAPTDRFVLFMSPRPVVIAAVRWSSVVAPPVGRAGPPPRLASAAADHVEALTRQVGDRGVLHPRERIRERRTVLDGLLELVDVRLVGHVDVRSPGEAAGRAGD